MLILPPHFPPSPKESSRGTDFYGWYRHLLVGHAEKKILWGRGGIAGARRAFIWTHKFVSGYQIGSMQIFGWVIRGRVHIKARHLGPNISGSVAPRCRSKPRFLPWVLEKWGKQIVCLVQKNGPANVVCPLGRDFHYHNHLRCKVFPYICDDYSFLCHPCCRCLPPSGLEVKSSTFSKVTGVASWSSRRVSGDKNLHFYLRHHRRRRRQAMRS